MTNIKIETMLLIRHKSNSNFLVQKFEDGWRLPGISGGVERENMVGPIQRAVQEQLQLKVWVGRRLYEKSYEVLNLKIELYEAVLQDDVDIHSDFKWGVTEDIKSLILDNEEMRAALISQANEKAIIKNLAPWFQKGWYEHVNKWIADALENKFVINGSIEQVKVSDISLILRIPVINGELYFKATGSAARHEAKLSQHLNLIHKDKSVDVIDINESEGWFLMRELGGGSLRQFRDKHVWKKAINEYARLQVVETDYIDTLIALGLPDRRLKVLKCDIEKHLAGMCATGLDEETTTRVMALKPELLKMCEDMDGVIPYSIDHGDLHSANIRLVDDEIVFFDWGDATVTHPFFSTRIFWHSIDELIADESEWLGMVNEFRPYYLEPWTKFASIQELERLLLISDQLACVYRALSWYLYITPSREDFEESYKKPSQWLQVLLEHRELIG